MTVRESHHQPAPIPADTFAARILLLRHDRGLTQQQAAELCGLDDGSWSNWEKGAHPRDMITVVDKISRGLSADRDWLAWGGPLYQDEPLSRWITTPQCEGQLALLTAA